MTDRSSPNRTAIPTSRSSRTTTEQTYDASNPLRPLVRVLADIAQRVALEQVRRLAEQDREEAP